MNVSKLRASIVAVLLGIGLFFVLPFISSFMFGEHSQWYLILAIAVYSVSGVILGVIWPKMSWRLGLWLFAIWLPMLLFMVFLSADAVPNWKREILSLIGYALILVAGCLGGWLGSRISPVANPVKSASRGPEQVT